MKNRDPKGLCFRLCLVGGREKWKEGDGKGGRSPFFNDVWYNKKEIK